VATIPGGIVSFTLELLDRAKVFQGVESDYRLAQLLGVHPNNISNYRTGTSFPVNSIAWKLGELAGESPALAVAGVNLDRASNPEDRRIWRSLGAEILAAAKAREAAEG